MFEGGGRLRHFQQDLAATEEMLHRVLDLLEGVHARHGDNKGAVGLTWPPTTEEALIGEAHYICYELTWGWQPQQIADNIHANLDAKGVTLLDVGTMVNAAHSTYCPGNVCDAPTLCT